eukprot:20632-Heterococcus_DN1.PRE.1
MHGARNTNRQPWICAKKHSLKARAHVLAAAGKVCSNADSRKASIGYHKCIQLGHKGKASKTRLLSYEQKSGGLGNTAVNDKIIVRYDGVQRVKTDPFYTYLQFRVRTGAGPADDASNFKTVTGVNLIVDGGCHKWRCLQCPMKVPGDAAELQWSKALESVRKDVECFWSKASAHGDIWAQGTTGHVVKSQLPSEAGMANLKPSSLSGR